MAIYNEMLGGSNPAKDCTADASKILEGFTAAVGKEVVIGTMANNGDVNTAIVDGVLKEGYTSGGTIANLTEENIKNGVTIAGKVGTMRSKGFNVTITRRGTYKDIYGSNFYFLSNADGDVLVQFPSDKNDSTSSWTGKSSIVVPDGCSYTKNPFYQYMPHAIKLTGVTGDINIDFNLTSYSGGSGAGYYGTVTVTYV